MITIEDAAIKYYEQVDWSACENDRIISAFKSGAKFAQRMIPIEEAEEFINEDGKYLVLRSNGDWTTANFDKSINQFINYYSDTHKFTHFRPIELK